MLRHTVLPEEEITVEEENFDPVNSTGIEQTVHEEVHKEDSTHNLALSTQTQQRVHHRYVHARFCSSC